MQINFIALATNREYYDIVKAGEHSMTVEELIEELRGYPGDCKVVFKNDGGYTYGCVNDWYIHTESVEVEDDSEEEDLVMQRQEIECALSEAVRKNGGKPVKIITVTSDDGERLYLSVGYNDSGVFGVATDDEDFVPFDDLSDDEVESVYVSMTRW